MEELKQLPVWVCWKRKEVNGKTTKVPVNPHGVPAKSNDSNTWVSFSEASLASAKYDGIGFMFANGICGIDIDKCDTPESQARAKEIINLMNTYTEYSPSGTGYHLIFRCDLSKLPQNSGKLHPDYYYKNPHNGVECYFSGFTNRYFTYTGENVNDWGIEDRTTQIIEFLNKYMRKEKQVYSPVLTQKEKPPVRASTEEVREITIDILSIARNAKNGKDFMQLFDVGNTDKYNNDHSSADLALCRYLAFYSGGNAEEVDRLFRQSKLYRQKWERKDYRDGTINLAIANCDGQFYTPPNRPGRPSTRKKDTREIFSIDGLDGYLQATGRGIRYDVIAKKVITSGLGDEYADGSANDILPVKVYDELKEVFKKCWKSDVQDFCGVIIAKNHFNPVINMLKAVKWDGRDRLQDVCEILGIAQDAFSVTLVYKWLWQCVSMAYNTFKGAYGSDGVLVLTGEQGIGKTSFFRKLGGDYFHESGFLDFRDKDSLIRATSAWVTELGEIETTFRSDIERLKGFITQPIDRYRKPYGRADVEIERHTSFCATANSREFLIDPSGNRRFWTVPVTQIDMDKLDELDVPQLWAEFDVIAKGNRQGFRLTRDEHAQLKERNAPHEKLLKSEAECRDIMAQASDFDYRYVTVTQFKDCHDTLRSYSVDAIGKALSKMGIEPERLRDNGPQKRVRRLPIPSIQ